MPSSASVCFSKSTPARAADWRARRAAEPLGIITWRGAVGGEWGLA